MQELGHLKIMTVTWNMGGAKPTTEEMDKLFFKDAILHDMYVIAT